VGGVEGPFNSTVIPGTSCPESPNFTLIEDVTEATAVVTRRTPKTIATKSGSQQQQVINELVTASTHQTDFTTHITKQRFSQTPYDMSAVSWRTVSEHTTLQGCSTATDATLKNITAVATITESSVQKKTPKKSDKMIDDRKDSGVQSAQQERYSSQMDINADPVVVLNNNGTEILEDGNNNSQLDKTPVEDHAKMKTPKAGQQTDFEKCPWLVGCSVDFLETRSRYSPIKMIPVLNSSDEMPDYREAEPDYLSRV